MNGRKFSVLPIDRARCGLCERDALRPQAFYGIMRLSDRSHNTTRNNARFATDSSNFASHLRQ